MTYFDAAYIAKCYLDEPGSEQVRAVAYAVSGLCSCEIARIEFACILQRHVRERQITVAAAREVLDDFREDEENGVWRWLPVTPGLVEQIQDRVSTLSPGTYIRAGDALHLGCAKMNGLQKVYTNDRHMLDAATWFGLQGINAIELP